MSFEEVLHQINKLIIILNDGHLFSKECIQDIEDSTKIFIPRHIDWLSQALSDMNNESLEWENCSDKREILSKVIVSVHNLALDFEELEEQLLEISEQFDKEMI